MKEAAIVDAIRTPFCRSGEKGFLRNVRSDDMGVVVLQELVQRTKVDPGSIDEVILGAVEMMGEQAHPGRNVLFLAGFPFEIPGLSLERACVTAMSAIHVAAMSIQCGMGDIYIAGGLDSMTHLSLPVVTPDTDFDELLKVKGTMLSAMNPNPRMYERANPVDLVGGVTAEKLAEMYDISREEMDKWALMSHQRAVAAQQEGRFKDEIVPVEGELLDGTKKLIDADQGPRADSTLEKISSLPTPFKPVGGRINAASSSGTADGAAAVMLMSKDKAKEFGLKPLATIRAMAVAACDPTIMGYSVVPATKKALNQAGLFLDDMELIEVNEAFALIPIVFMREFGVRDAERINVNGGACALGHPVGASGARLVGTLAYEMLRRGNRWGLAAICGGYGQGGATILEREDYWEGRYAFSGQ